MLEKIKRWVNPKQKERKEPSPSDITFDHEGQQFTVQREIVNPNSSSRILVRYSIFDSQGLNHGVVRGELAHAAAFSAFQAHMSTNLRKDTDRHIRHLVGTAIGEIVAQYPWPFMWSSDKLLLDGGANMYKFLLRESQREGSRFHGRIFVKKYPTEFGGGYFQYAISNERQL